MTTTFLIQANFVLPRYCSTKQNWLPQLTITVTEHTDRRWLNSMLPWNTNEKYGFVIVENLYRRRNIDKRPQRHWHTRKWEDNSEHECFIIYIVSWSWWNGNKHSDWRLLWMRISNPNFVILTLIFYVQSKK